jgi:hypothetical protein
MRDEQLEVSVSFDPRRGYFTVGSELSQNVTALSLGGLRRRIEPRCYPTSPTKVRDILDSKETTEKKIEALTKYIQIDDLKSLQEDLERHGINKQRIEAIEHQDEEEAELEKIQVKQMSAVELITIVGAKGLSADHVIVIGFDNVNMNWVTRTHFLLLPIEGYPPSHPHRKHLPLHPRSDRTARRRPAARSACGPQGHA